MYAIETKDGLKFLLKFKTQKDKDVALRILGFEDIETKEAEKLIKSSTEEFHSIRVLTNEFEFRYTWLSLNS